MNKLCTAMAVLSACGGAHAQSSLTLFGMLDAGVAVGRGSISNRTQLVGSGLNSSRLGLRGAEDLGDGLTASFWLEAGLNNDNGTGATTNTNNQGTGASNAGSGGLTFNRRSTLSLDSATWGELRLGRDFSPQFLNSVLYDPFGATGVGANQLIIGSTSAGPWGINGGTSGAAVRSSNGLSYFTPKIGSGVYGMLQHFRGENASNTPIGQDGTGSGVRIGWKPGWMDVSYTRAKTSYATGDITQDVLGGYVEFDTVRLSAAYQRDSVASARPDGRGWLLGATVRVGAGHILASYSGYHTNAPTRPGAKKLVLSYVHSLSKRTALYAITAQLSNQGNSTQALNGAVAGPGTKSKGFTFGVRHGF